MTRVPILVVLVALVAACGGGGEEDAPPGQATTVLTTTVVKTTTVVQTVTTTKEELPAADFDAFRTPSGNIACRTFGPFDPPASVRCDLLSGLRPQPQGECELDWAGLYLYQRGKVKPACAGDSVYEAGAPVLGYGKRWRQGTMVCVSQRTGLECRNGSGHGFFLSRSRWDVF
jgi:hypothetical protein